MELVWEQRFGFPRYNTNVIEERDVMEVTKLVTIAFEFRVVMNSNAGKKRIGKYIS